MTSSRWMGVLAIALACVPAGAEEIQGKVVKVDGNRVQISLSGDVVPEVGDPIRIFVVLPGVQEEASVGSGQVTSVDKGSVEARMNSTTSQVREGYSAGIVTLDEASGG